MSDDIRKSNLFFLLHARQWSGLLPTIKSRVQRVKLDETSGNYVHQRHKWLQSDVVDSGGELQDLYQILWKQWLDRKCPRIMLSDKLSAFALRDVVYAMQDILFAHCSQQVGVESRGSTLHAQLTEAFGPASSRLSQWDNYKLSKRLQKATAVIESGVAHTGTYQLESLVIAGLLLPEELSP